MTSRRIEPVSFLRKLAFRNGCGKLAALKDLWSQLIFRSRYPLAIVAGLLLAAAFPKIGIAGLAWVVPAFMLLAAHGKSGADAFRIGYVAGLAFYLAALYWLLLIPVTGYPILGWVSLSAYLALYPADVGLAVAGKVGEGGWFRRALWSLGGAAIWVALEMVVGRLFSGFPWRRRQFAISSAAADSNRLRHRRVWRVVPGRLDVAVAVHGGARDSAPADGALRLDRAKSFCRWACWSPCSDSVSGNSRNPAKLNRPCALPLSSRAFRKR